MSRTIWILPYGDVKAGVGITLSVDVPEDSQGNSLDDLLMGDEEIERLVSLHAGGQVQKAKSLMRRIGESTLEEVQTAYAEERDPDGSPFPSLSPKYGEWKDKHYPGQAILRRDDILYNSLDFKETDSYVDVGSINGPPYAGAHNFGSGRLPKREFAGVSDAFADRLGLSIETWFETGDWESPN